MQIITMHTGRKVAITFLLLFLWLPVRVEAQRPGLLKDVKRIVFLGDSITYGGDFVSDFELWLLSRGIDVEVLNLGLPSETATELTATEQERHFRPYGFPRPFVGERLDRVLAATRPDLVFVCYGMNDASSVSRGEGDLQRFQEAIVDIREAAARHGVKRVIHLTPPVYDAAGKPGPDPDSVLTRYTQWLLGKRREGWLVADLHTPMRRALDERRRSDPSFAFARDGVHPGREGHWLMAQQVIAFLGDRSVLELVTSDVMLDRPVRSLVHERMSVRRDAWLSHTGHTRPGLPAGLPLSEMRARVADLTSRILKETGAKILNDSP